MEEEAPAPAPASSSPNSRLKFLCSFNGRILPRPSDGQFKYVGGDTRVLAVPRSISFSELKEKIAAVCDSDVVIRYQLMPEDLDALVTVKSDEDVRHMVDEYDRQEAARSSSSSSPTSGTGDSTGGGGGTPRFHVYLFPANQSTIAAAAHHHHYRQINSLEQRYIDALNDVHVLATASRRIDGGGDGKHPIFTISSAGSSPTSADAAANDIVGLKMSRAKRFHPMHKAHSSPNLLQMEAVEMAAVGEGHRYRPHSYHHHHHYHRRNHLPHQNSVHGFHHPNGAAGYGGPMWRIPVGTHCIAGGGGSPIIRPVHHLHRRRYGGGGAPMTCCQVEEFCCSRRSVEGCYSHPAPMKQMRE